MKKHIFALSLGAMLFALCVPAEAQQPTRIPRIGYVIGSGPGPLVDAFRQGLRDFGYIEGKNILVEYRYAEGKTDRIASLVAELVQLPVDVLVSTTGRAILAAKQMTKTVPIVMVSINDPVAAGFVDSLARPGGNITGLSTLVRELAGNRLELLKEIVPGISRVGVLLDPESPFAGIAFKEYESAAPTLRIQLQSLGVRAANPDLEGAFQAGVKGRANALVVARTPVLTFYSKRITDLAIKNRLPSMCEQRQYVENGCLVSYAANDVAQWERAAYYVDRILKGTKPAELPVEQPTKFEFIINLKTAKQIGLTIPPNVLARADKVIK